MKKTHWCFTEDFECYDTNHRLKDITHDVHVIFIAEVCAFVNNRPLMDVSNDPEAPILLIPSMPLTMKTNTQLFPSFGTRMLLSPQENACT